MPQVQIIESQPQFFRTVFIFNPRSGGIGFKRGIIRLIDRIWGATSRRYSILVTTRAGEGERLAREEVNRGADLVVAVGGDGTLNEVVRGVLGTKACVGLLAAGSGNGFARHWGIPLNLNQACRGLLLPRLVKCDVGQADSHIFLVTFGCGLDAAISERYAHSLIRGMVPYFYHGVCALSHYQGLEAKVRNNGHILYSGRPLLLTVANTRGYGGGTIIAPQAQADDGLLDFCALDRLPWKMTLRHVRDLFNGGIQRIPGYRHAQVTEVIIERAEKGAIHVDGDPHHGSHEIRIGIMPAAITFALPA